MEQFGSRLEILRYPEKIPNKLMSIIPESIPEKPKSDEEWKDQYFKKTRWRIPTRTGAFLARAESHKKLKNAPKNAEYWKNQYFKKNPELIRTKTANSLGLNSTLIKKQRLKLPKGYPKACSPRAEILPSFPRKNRDPKNSQAIVWFLTSFCS